MDIAMDVFGAKVVIASSFEADFKVRVMQKWFRLEFDADSRFKAE